MLRAGCACVHATPANNLQVPGELWHSCMLHSGMLLLPVVRTEHD